MSDTMTAETIVLEYDLYDLPTAQHKAGLAGLILMIESMGMRKMEHLPDVDYNETRATITFTRKSMQGLFDDLYDASWAEAWSRTRWKKREPKRIEQVEIQSSDEKKRVEKRFVYDVIRPKGEFLQALYSGNEGWVKLWRDMLWATLRGIPKTRSVYEERVAGKRSSQASRAEANILKAQAARLKGNMQLDGIVGSLYLGAQDVNAERVPFQGGVEQNLLLHFWTIASLTYVPRELGTDGKMKDAGYVLAIPEPASLKPFIRDARTLLGELGSKSEMAGYRPRDAVVSIPEEGGLEYLYHLAHYRVEQTDLSSSVIAVEIYHVDKQGNNIRTLGAERILPDTAILEDYETLRKECHNPLFKSQRIRNLLADNQWHYGMNALFNQYPREFFIQSGDSPHMPFFGNDVQRRLRALEIQRQFKKGARPMNGGTVDDHLVLCVHRLIREYANRRTEEKCGVKYEEFKNQKDDKGRTKYPQKYREAREKVCSDVFLAMRGRRDQDFVEYFTGTICSVPQYLPEDDYLVVSQSLLADWETIKALAMLALSAASRVGGISEEQEKGGD